MKKFSVFHSDRYLVLLLNSRHAVCTNERYCIVSLRTSIGKTIRQLENRAKRYHKLYIAPVLNFYLRNKTPIVIYQMGKVGSSSVYQSLLATTQQPVYQVHFLLPDATRSVIKMYRDKQQPVPFHVYEGQQLYQHIVRRGYPTKYITLVREPIGRTLSDFFENYALLTGKPFADAEHSVAETIDLVQKYSHPDYALRWFDDEFYPALGIDIYAHAFSHERGYLRLQHEHMDLLVLRIEDDDAVLEQAITSFLGLEGFELSAANVGAKKAYSDMYQQVKQTMRLSPAFVDVQLNSRYAKHFYTSDERTVIRERWLGN